MRLTFAAGKFNQRHCNIFIMNVYTDEYQTNLCSYKHNNTTHFYDTLSILPINTRITKSCYNLKVKNVRKLMEIKK